MFLKKAGLLSHDWPRLDNCLCHPSIMAPGRSYAHDAAAIGRWPRSPGWSEPAASEGLIDPMGWFLGENPPEKPGGTSDIYILYIYTYMELSMGNSWNIYHTHITYRCVSHHHLMIVMWWLMMTQATSLRILRVVPIIESCATAVGLCRDVQMHIYSHYELMSKNVVSQL